MLLAVALLLQGHGALVADKDGQPTGSGNRFAMLESKAQEAEPLDGEATWVTTSDYPLTALRDERFGTTATVLTVGTDGRVSDCSIAASSGSVDLDEAACTAIVQRARFRPALDAQGRPVSSTYRKRVRWSLPELVPVIEPHQGFTSVGGMIARLHIDQSGVVTSCTVINAANSSAPQPHHAQDEICLGLRREFAENPVQSSSPDGSWIELRQLSYGYRADPGWAEPISPVRPPVVVPSLPPGVS